MSRPTLAGRSAGAGAGGGISPVLKREAQPIEPLSAAETQVLKLLCKNPSNQKISKIPGIKLPTVKTHVSRIRRLGSVVEARPGLQPKSRCKKMDDYRPFDGIDTYFPVIIHLLYTFG